MKAQLVLGEISEIFDCEHKTAPLESDGIPSIRTPNIGKGRFILDGVNRVSEKTYQLWTRRAIPMPGDVILAREAPVGNAAIIPFGLKVCLGQRTVLIRPDKKRINGHYLSYLLNTKELGDHLVNISNGATVGHLNVTDIRKLKLPVDVPSLPTQKNIAAILSAYDELIEVNNRRIAILEGIADQLYREWFIRLRFPGHENAQISKGVPVGWQIIEARQIIKDVVKGKSYTGNEINEIGEGIPFISLKSVDRGGGYRHDGLKFYTGLCSDAQILEPGNIVMAVTDMTQDRAIVGRVARIPRGDHEKYSLSADLVKLIPDTNISALILYTILRYSSFSDSLKEFANGANVLHLRPDLIQKQRIIFPGWTLLKMYGDKINPIYTEIDALTPTIQKLQLSRDMLLSRLMSAKIDVEKLDIRFPDSIIEKHEVANA